MSNESLREELAALAWSLWAELGVSGWERRHSRWFIDLEALLVYTVWLGDTDARLRDEVTDWCIRFGSWVSANRLTNLLPNSSAYTRENFGELAATVGVHSGVRWRGATEPRRYRPTGRSRLESFEAPALVGLRLRGFLGIGARAEVMRVFLAEPAVPKTASDLVDDTAFKKRNIADALESLRWGELLQAERAKNRKIYRLREPGRFEAAVGARPDVWARWTLLIPAMMSLADAVERARTLPARVAGVELAKVLREDSANIVAARMPPPPAPSPDTQSVERVTEWLRKVVHDLAQGNSHAIR